jgi:hypothetical protein
MREKQRDRDIATAAWVGGSIGGSKVEPANGLSPAALPALPRSEVRAEQLGERERLRVSYRSQSRSMCCEVVT